MNALEICGILFLVQVAICMILISTSIIATFFKFRTARLQKQVVDKFTDDIKNGKFELNAVDKNEINKQIKDNDQTTNEINLMSEDEAKKERERQFHKALNDLKAKYNEKEY